MSLCGVSGVGSRRTVAVNARDPLLPGGLLRSQGVTTTLTLMVKSGHFAYLSGSLEIYKSAAVAAAVRHTLK
jgi:hypothetical protein